MQHDEVWKTADDEMQYRKVGKTAEEEFRHDEVGQTAEEEMQHDEVGKTADEEKMQLENVTPDSEASHYEVTQIKYEGDGFNVVLSTCADIAESAQVGHVTKDGEDASAQEAEHHKTDEDDGRLMMEQERNDMEHGRAIEEEEFYWEVERQRQIHVEQPALESETRFERRNADDFKTEVTDHHIGQVRRLSLHDPLDMRPSKVPKDRPRFSSRRDQAPKRSSFERNGQVAGRRRSPLSKSRRYSSWARKKAGCRDMLRKYVDKEHVMCSVTDILDSVECPELKIEDEPIQGNEYCDDVKIANELVGNPAWELRELLREYKEIFSDVPGLTKLEEHAITLNTTTAIRRKSYPVPFAKATDIETEVKKMMIMGIIEPSKSPFCSPLLLIKKTDGSLRPVVDFRLLNRATVFDAEPMPSPEEIYAKLHEGKFFSTFDFCKGYWRIPMNLEDKEKTAVSSTLGLGLFQFVRMPFGLVNAGATYEHIMRKLLSGMHGFANYVDDVSHQ